MRVKWSQNFLKDPGLAQKCVGGLRLNAQDAVLEIGPGKGILTQVLLQQAGFVAAVEIDPELSESLQRKFGADPKFKLVQKDFLETDFAELGLPPSYKVIGNLPYAVTSPILQKFLSWPGWSSAIVMVQKEVGERMLAKPGGKDYGVLSISIQSRCTVKKYFSVSAGNFRPAPQVESSVMLLEPLPAPVFAPQEERDFFNVVRSAFMHRRKTILNALSYHLKQPPAQIKQALAECGIAENARAEVVTIAQFYELSKKLV